MRPQCCPCPWSHFPGPPHSAAWCCTGTTSSSSQASDQTQLNGAVTSKPQKGGAPKAKKEEARPIDLSLLSLRVGVIRKAERHPDADTLYVEEVDCGEAQPRTVPSHLPLALHFACGSLLRSCIGHSCVQGDCESPVGTSSYACQASSCARCVRGDAMKRCSPPSVLGAQKSICLHAASVEHSWGCSVLKLLPALSRTCRRVYTVC